MPNERFKLIESGKYKAYIGFDKDSEIQLNAIRNELAGALLEVHDRKNKEPPDIHDDTFSRKYSFILCQGE